MIGRSFWEGAVGAVLDATEEPELELLEERDFVRRRPRSSLEGQREYVFKHALTREVAYGALPAAERARAHADFADWLERAAGGDEHASLLAHHYAEAVAPEQVDFAWADDELRASELRERALRWLSRAAELAFGRFELEDSAGLYRRAVDFEPESEARSELWAAAARASMVRFDTDGFREAMEHALSLELPRPAAARLYAQLGREASRPYLWKHPPSRAITQEWIERALELAEPGSEARAVAISAWAQLDPAGRAAAAREGAELAEQLGDPLLQLDAYETQAKVSSAHGRLDEATDWADRRLALLPESTDPDLRSGQWLLAEITYLRAGRIADGRRAAERHDEVSARLTPHHEVHGAAFMLLANTVDCDWGDAAGLSARAEQAAEANADTPCQFNWRGLLMVALAHAQLGQEGEALRLEERAAELLTVGGPLAKEPALLRLALLRGDLETVERLLAVQPEIDFWDIDYPAARLDALAAVGDRPRVENEAAAAIDVGGYVAPFALRALGTVRGDDALREQAAERFERLGLGWRAEETRGRPG